MRGVHTCTKEKLQPSVFVNDVTTNKEPKA
jgi:hypothetical protein